jgi:hypothetical protein
MITGVRRRNRRGGVKAPAPAEPFLPAVPITRPRPVCLTGTGRFVVFIAVLLTTASLVAGMWLLSLAARDRDLRRRIAIEAVSARAEVVALSRTRGDDPRYLVDYNYTAAGQTFEARRAIRRSLWNRLHPGSPLEVGYLPDEPGKSWVTGYEPRGVPVWLGPLVALAFASLAWLSWHGLRGQWMLLSEGRAAVAHVTGWRNIAKGKGGRHLEVSYEYRLMSGAARTGKYQVVVGALGAASKAQPPADGTPLRVIYDPNNPARSSRYPLSLVRIA